MSSSGAVLGRLSVHTQTQGLPFAALSRELVPRRLAPRGLLSRLFYAERRRRLRVLVSRVITQRLQRGSLSRQRGRLWGEQRESSVALPLAASAVVALSPSSSSRFFPLWVLGTRVAPLVLPLGPASGQGWESKTETPFKSSSMLSGLQGPIFFFLWPG